MPFFDYGLLCGVIVIFGHRVVPSEPVPEQSQTTRAAAGACDEIVKRLDQTGLGMIKPPSRQRRGATGGRAAGHQNRLDGTLRKDGSSLAVVRFFVDELSGRPALPRTRAVELYAPCAS
jgi:hypothetical protein